MNDVKLIELVRQNPMLYDPSHPKYMDGILKTAAWIRIGHKLRQESLACKARWNNIRDNYRKSLRKVPRSGKYYRKMKIYKYSEYLSFLTQYFDESKINVEGDEEDYTEPKEENSETENLDNELREKKEDTTEMNDLLGINDLSNQEPSIKRKFPQPGSQVMDYLNGENKKKKVDPVDAFLAGIAPTLKSMHAYHLNLAKSEIFAVVQKYEMEMILEQHPEWQHSNNATSSSSTLLLSSVEFKPQITSSYTIPSPSVTNSNT